MSARSRESFVMALHPFSVLISIVGESKETSNNIASDDADPVGSWQRRALKCGASASATGSAAALATMPDA